MKAKNLLFCAAAVAAVLVGSPVWACDNNCTQGSGRIIRSIVRLGAVSATVRLV